MWVCMCVSVGVRGGALEGYVSCSNYLYYGFKKIRYVCFIIVKSIYAYVFYFIFYFLNETL